MGCCLGRMSHMPNTYSLRNGVFSESTCLLGMVEGVLTAVDLPQRFITGSTQDILTKLSWTNWLQSAECVTRCGIELEHQKVLKRFAKERWKGFFEKGIRMTEKRRVPDYYVKAECVPNFNTFKMVSTETREPNQATIE